MISFSKKMVVVVVYWFTRSILFMVSVWSVQMGTHLNKQGVVVVVGEGAAVLPSLSLHRHIWYRGNKKCLKYF